MPRRSTCRMVVLSLLVALAAARGAAAGKALLKASGVTGGLVVHVGCGDGTLTASLHGSPAHLVKGLSTDPARVAEAREHLAAAGLIGSVAAAQYDGKALPLVDNLVNLLVISDPDYAVPAAETVRALAPRGVVLVPAKTGAIRGLRETECPDLPGWRRFVKPVPGEIDDWTHFLHGPDGHAMSNDRVVGPPSHIQWIGAPQHSRSHIHLTSVSVMVSSGGRLFYIADEGLTALPSDLPSRWALFARDAFNGVPLWKRPLASWQPYHVKDRNSFPADLHRRLVASDGMVFATLGIHGPVSAMDAATGKTLRAYAGTEKTEDIVYEGGLLHLSVNTGDKKDINRLSMAYRHTEPQQKRIVVVEAASGKQLWEKTDDDTNGLMPMTLAVRNGRLYFQNPKGVVCLDRKTGKRLWLAPRPSEYMRPGWSSPTLVVFDGVVISADRQSGPNQKVKKDQYAAGGFSTGDLVAFAADTGKRLWSAACAEGCRAPTDVFGLDGKVWFGESLERRTHEYRKAYDLRTGELLGEMPEDENWPKQHHHRCYRDKATSRFILANRTGIEFIEIATGKVSLNNWLRGNCKFGVMPANGLLYLPPEQCGCYVEGKLTGFHALAPDRPAARLAKDRHPVVQGPAFGGLAIGAESGAQDWPTFRGDSARTGRARTTVSTKLAPSWQRKLGGRLSQPVVADGRLYVAAIDQHILHVLDAGTGALLHTFVAGARIDSPPTVAQGLAVFGCHDGWVYALDTKSGQLAWRTRAAPAATQLVDRGQVESVWPVHGSVLIQKGVVHCAAGRSSFVDGGVRMLKLDLRTGRVLQAKTHFSRDPETGATVPLYEPFPGPKRLLRIELPGVLPDVISSDGEKLWMRAVTFSPDHEILQEFPAHVFCSMGFLDDSWWELTYLMYGPHMFSGRSGVAESARRYPTGRLLVVGSDKVYGYQDGYESIRTPALAASAKKPEVKTTKRGKRTIRRVVLDWRKKVPLQAQGMVLAGDTLFLAGAPKTDRGKAKELLKTLTTSDYEAHPDLRLATETFLGKHGGRLVAVSTKDGLVTMDQKLDTIPVFDGLIAANGRLYISQANGTVACLASTP
ncbi:MAG: PQQ-binding-like beta-propeller repeat protein [Victivallales bacterium]|nr:PQQ-binding-like beta-propeller repeat protein [Victivallales bacterium]